VEIISIDPSAEATGIIRWKDTEHAITTLALTATIGGAEAWLGLVLHSGFVGNILVERPAQGPGADPHTYEAFLRILRLCDERDQPTVVISPGEWKPVAKARKWRGLDVWGPHANDAYLMLRYWRFLQNGK
jgi:hypothetical protein